MLIVSRIIVLPDDLNGLAAKAGREGFRFVDRLIYDFASGTNTFSNAGEALFEVRKAGALIGIGGLNKDPYSGDATVGRVRRLYVDPDYRGEGVGRCLMEAIEHAARDSFSQLQLFTDTIRARKFYSRLGYEAVAGNEKVSHVKRLREP